MFKNSKRLFILFLLLATTRCGENGTSYCAPNFEGSGLSILMTRVTGTLNQYEITICSEARTNNNTMTVYGVFDEADIPSMTLATKARQSHIEDSSSPGNTFFVTFNNDDRWFVIYEDDSSDNFSNLTELVRGEFR